MIYIGDGELHASIYYWKLIRADQGNVKVLKSDINLNENILLLKVNIISESEFLKVVNSGI